MQLNVLTCYQRLEPNPTRVMPERWQRPISFLKPTPGPSRCERGDSTACIRCHEGDWLSPQPRGALDEDQPNRHCGCRRRPTFQSAVPRTSAAPWRWTPKRLEANAGLAFGIRGRRSRSEGSVTRRRRWCDLRCRDFVLVEGHPGDIGASQRGSARKGLIRSRDLTMCSRIAMRLASGFPFFNAAMMAACSCTASAVTWLWNRSRKRCVCA